VRILLTGLGSIGQRHARNLRALFGDGVELLAYRVAKTVPLLDEEMRADPVGDVERAYGIRAFDDLELALAQRPDAVLVTNPASLHVQVARAAAAAGAHLLVEKPLSNTFDGVEELIDLAERKGLVTLVGYQLRFHPGLQMLNGLLEREELGAVLGARFSFGEHLPDWHPWEDYRSGNAARADQGGGVVLAQIHDLDVAYALFGLPDRVFAVGGRRSSLELEVEDTASILLDCNGMPVHLHQDVVRRPPVRSYEVIGEHATAFWDYHANELRVTGDDGSVRRTEFAGFRRNDLFLDELRHFFACLDGRERPIVNLREGAASLRIALAAKASLEGGEAVALR
jgi:predicted dehydrogenase